MQHAPRPSPPLAPRSSPSLLATKHFDPVSATKLPSEPHHPAPPPASPALVQRGWNLATSLAEFVSDGCRTVSPAESSVLIWIFGGKVGLEPDGEERGGRPPGNGRITRRPVRPIGSPNQRMVNQMPHQTLPILRKTHFRTGLRKWGHCTVFGVAFRIFI